MILDIFLTATCSPFLVLCRLLISSQTLTGSGGNVITAGDCAKNLMIELHT